MLMDRSIRNCAYDRFRLRHHYDDFTLLPYQKENINFNSHINILYHINHNTHEIGGSMKKC